MTLNLARTGLRKAPLFVTLAVAALLGSGSIGCAQTTVTIDCTSNPGALVAGFTTGLFGLTINKPGDVVQVKGVCVGAVLIDGRTSATPLGSTGAIIQPYPSGGHVQGSLTIAVPNVTINNLLIDGTGQSGTGLTITSAATGTILNDVTIQNFPGHGLSVGMGSVTVNGGLITGNANCGAYVFNNGMAWLNADASAVPVEITANGTGPAGSTQCGVDVEDGASLAITSANIHDNLGGSALRIFMAMADVSGGTFQSPATIAYPTIAVERGSLGLRGATVTGTGQSNAIFASPGSTIKMQNSSVSQSDPKNAAILVADGSVLLSVGGNTITNSAAGGSAITVANAGTFHQRNEASMGIPLAADTFTGNGIVQVQSNMELGMASALPSIWNGSISVQQNSSFRMDGDITVSGSVVISQGSNAFFNKAAGTNIVDGGVTCTGTIVVSHVAGVVPSSNVFLADGHTSAVTIGTSAPACPSF